MPDNETVVSQDNEESTFNPFDESKSKVDIPVDETAKEVIVKDPVIEEKDKHIEEKPVSDKPNEPEKIPTATPKDIPARTSEEKEDIKPANELKFANETSERIFNLLKEGKEDELLDVLNQKRVLKNIDKLPSADIIKLQLKNENKDYTPTEIEDLYNETFISPEKPEQGLEETDEDFQHKLDKYNSKLATFERKIEREAKSSKSELLKLQQELVLPDISKPEAITKQPTQEELEATKKARENYLSSIDEGLDFFKSIDATYKDKDVEIPVAYKISADERKELKSVMENFNLEQFIQDRWITKDGKFNTAQQAKDLFLLTKGESAIAKLVNEAGSKKYEQVIKAQKNVDYSGNNKSANFSPNHEEEMDKMAQYFFSR